MIGSWKWNFYVALAAMAITIGTAQTTNEWGTSLIRGGYAFFVVFVFVYALRFVFGTAAGLKQFTNSDTRTMMDVQADETTGTAVNLATPSDDELLNTMLKDQLASDHPSQTNQFTPLVPQKLVSKDKLDPEKLAQSLRQMSEE